jgi:very-short-patch-repair endonuclease
MWLKIRGKRLAGLKFRRQHVVGNFIADFVCLPARLIIEVDGDTHGGGEAELRDAKRTEEIEQAGYRVIRFWDHLVLSDKDGVVVETILDALMASALPELEKARLMAEGYVDDVLLSSPSPRPSPVPGEGELRAVATSP